MRPVRLGCRQPPHPGGEVELLPLGTEQLTSARPKQERQAEVRAPAPVRLLRDGGERSAELLRAEETIALLLAERSDAGGGIVAGVEAPRPRQVKDRAQQR